MTRALIERALPHRPPMLLVDEIISQTANSITCRKTFTPDEFFFQGHYPGQPIVPGVILCECIVQTGAILLSGLAQTKSGVPVLTRMSDVKFKRIVRPGETIELVAKLNETLGEAYFLTGTGRCSGSVAVRLDFACSVTSDL